MRLVQLIGAIVTLVVLVAAVLFLFWRSSQEWGSLPSASGSGTILYVGVAAAIVAAAAYAFWTWREWRVPD